MVGEAGLPYNISDGSLSRETSQTVSGADWPDDLIGEVTRCLKSKNVAPRKPDFQFRMDGEAAEKNFFFSLKTRFGPIKGPCRPHRKKKTWWSIGAAAIFVQTLEAIEQLSKTHES